MACPSDTQQTAELPYSFRHALLFSDVGRTTNPASKTMKEVIPGLGFKGWVTHFMPQITIGREGLVLLVLGPFLVSTENNLPLDLMQHSFKRHGQGSGEKE